MQHLLRREPSWRLGLIHIQCSRCGRDLDWAQPAFLAAHPSPRCWDCPQVEPPPQLPIRAHAEVIRVEAEVIPAEAEVLEIEAPSPVNLAFEAAVAEAEAVER